ncbi:AsmA-like C-terminal region-containing protein [Maricaulis sp.]|uniref:YhdP family protein n=1 Tax=Maricaulis sp. TaxID=1486257 RepID=UPI001B188812|nr:AsmA-like C-terminal region-containing protein [Maricaulis sp.]MBO6798261.1 hypothetical protein [Maricaulis sp.]
MLRRSAKWTLIYILEAVAVLLMMVIFGLGFIFWRLSSGPVDLGFLREDVQAQIAQMFEGDVVALGDLEARYESSEGAIIVTARDVAVAQADGEVIARAPLIEAGLAIQPMIFGRIEPTQLRVHGGSVSIVRRADGAVGAGLGGVDRVAASARQPERGGDDSASLFLLLQDPEASDSPLGRIRNVEVRDATVRIIDQISGVAWLVNNARVELARDEFRIVSILQGQIATASGFADLNIRMQAGARLTSLLLEVDVDQLYLASVAPTQGPFSALRALDAPLSLDLIMDARLETGIQTASLELDIGEGVILSQGEEHGFEGAELSLVFDPQVGSLSLDRGRIVSDVFAGELSGRIYDLDAYAGALPMRWRYEFSAGEGFVDLGEIFERPPRWGGLDVSGRADLNERRIDYEALNVQLDRIRAELTGYASLSQVADGRWLPNIVLSGPVLGDVTAEAVLSYWPVDLADGARDWIEEGILGGRFYNSRLDMNIDAESIASGALANDRLNLSFDVEDGIIRYISTMTPITEAVGSATLYGNAFEASLTAGRVGDIIIHEGHVDIPRLNPKGAIATYSGRGYGTATDILALIDEEPLGFPTEYGIDPQAVGGEGEITFQIQRPMLSDVPAEDIPFVITGDLTGVALAIPETPLALSQGTVSITADQNRLTASGDAFWVDTPVSVNWVEDFTMPDGQPSTTFEVEARLGARALDEFGIPARRYLDGFVGVEARAISNGLDIQSIDVDADLTEAWIEAPDGVWFKEIGVEGLAGFTLSRNDARNYVFEEIIIQTEGVEIGADAQLSPGGRLVELNLDHVEVNDFISLRGRLAAPPEPGQPFTARLSGDYLDAREILEIWNNREPVAPEQSTADESDTADAFSLPLSVTFDVARMAIEEDEVLEDFSLIWRSEEDGIRAVAVSGRSSAGPFFASFGAPEEGGIREFRVETQSIERLSAFIGFSEGVVGGRMSVLGEAPPLGVDGPLTARVEIDDITLVRVPVLARILAAGSFEGLGALLNGDGIRFERITGDVMFEDGLFTIGESQATGSSLGVTAAGSIDFEGRSAAIDGNLAPSYAVNSFFGNLPVIGELLISRPGEGVVGITYSVEGPFDSLTVFANPLSVLAPGVFRRMFEGTAAERAAANRGEDGEPAIPSVLPPEVLERLRVVEEPGDGGVVADPVTGIPESEEPSER